jgi:hypothetical protein
MRPTVLSYTDSEQALLLHIDIIFNLCYTGYSRKRYSVHWSINDLPGRHQTNIFKILAGAVFNLLGVFILYNGIRTTRDKGLADGFVDMISGFAFILIGLLIWTGYIS